MRKAEKVFFIDFEVRPKGALTTYGFPLDMLRYDRAWPARSEDANRIDMLVSKELDHEGAQEWPIHLRMASGTHEGPTVGRWESFGWEVVRVER